MRAAPKAVILAMAAATMTLSVAMAQDEEVVSEPRKVKILLKPYKPLDPNGVYQAARDNVQAPVRFRDAFKSRSVVPDAARSVKVGKRDYQIVLAFRTERELLCLVAGRNARVLRMLLGLPSDWPVTAAALRRDLLLRDGQQVFVAGTVLGTVVGEKLVLVDSLSLTEASQLVGRKEVRLLWPNEKAPREFLTPGSHRVAFPCTHVAGKPDLVDVSITPLTEQQVMGGVAALTARLEGRSGGTKNYGLYDATAAYRHAGEKGRTNIEFSDKVFTVMRGDLPEEITTVTVLRAGKPARVPVRVAFETARHVVCLVPATWPTLNRQAERLLPGEEVLVRGTAIGPCGPYNCVVVDYLGFPAMQRTAGGSETWWVSVEWPGQEPRAFWGAGTYMLRGLPCQNDPGRQEALQVQLAEFREVIIERPPAPPEAPEEGPAGKPQPEE